MILVRLVVWICTNQTYSISRIVINWLTPLLPTMFPEIDETMKIMTSIGKIVDIQINEIM